ncbi:hypothetical protein JB92DRAFT_1625059 [Gautieria morchelliformis]|nr:hypothetical protein JB92DRAFT_1625059 [Gautieria morchelliformis]
MPAPAESEQLMPAPTRTDSLMETDEVLHELEAGEVVIEEEKDEAMLNAIEAAINTAEAEMANGDGEAEAEVGISSEQTFASGMASTLAILRQQGILANSSADHLEREGVQLQRDLWLAEQWRCITQRELDRAKSRGSNKNQATCEYENRLREQQEARDSLDHFKHYKPDVTVTLFKDLCKFIFSTSLLSTHLSSMNYDAKKLPRYISLLLCKGILCSRRSRETRQGHHYQRFRCSETTCGCFGSSHF